VIYYGDEIGMGEDIELEDRRSHTNCNGRAPNAGFSQAPPDALYNPSPMTRPTATDRSTCGSALRRRSLLTRMREDAGGFAAHPVRSGRAALLGGNGPVLAYLAPVGCRLLSLNNLSPEPREVHLTTRSGPAFRGQPVHGAAAECADGALRLSLEPYGYRWLSLSDVCRRVDYSRVRSTCRRRLGLKPAGLM